MSQRDSDSLASPSSVTDLDPETRHATRGAGLRSRVSEGSALRSYQDLVVGSPSLWRLMLHELLAAWGATVPGAAGLAVRKLFWPKLFAETGRGSLWGQHITLRHPRKMVFGDRVVVDDGAYLDAKGCENGDFAIHDDAMISRGCILSAKEGGIIVRERATLGAGCVLYSFGGIDIGPDTMIAAQCYIGGGRYDARGQLDLPMHQQPLPGRGVVIEEDCWLGAGVTIVDGVRIGRGSIVGAGAVVIADVAPLSIVAGIPARPIADPRASRGSTDKRDSGSQR